LSGVGIYGKVGDQACSQSAEGELLLKAVSHAKSMTII
jgi:hypothetical protein